MLDQSIPWQSEQKNPILPSFKPESNVSKPFGLSNSSFLFSGLSSSGYVSSSGVTQTVILKRTNFITTLSHTS